ncbi:MAG: hypothetical protein HKN58_00710 [Xanthomonadales bacterium]|nr:hypothetical protein [Xanthomonadales bacterium]
MREVLFTVLILGLVFDRANAQDAEVYIVDVGPNRGAPWQVIRVDEDGQNPQQFINTGLSRPQDILFIEHRNLALVSNLFSNQITQYDAETGAFAGTFASGIGQPTRMEIGPDGLLYVLQWQGNGRVWRYDLDGQFIDEFTSIGVNQSIGMDWDNAGNLYVASFGGASVRKFDTDGNDLGLFINANLQGPTNIRFESNGDLLVLDWSGNSVKRFDASGNYLGVFMSGLGQAEGIEVLPNGNYIIGNGVTSSMKEFDASGQYVGEFVEAGTLGLATPNGVRVRHAQVFQINAGLNDAWVNQDAPFQGMFITVYPDLGLVFVAWFTFDSVPPDAGMATFGGIDQRWVTGLGTIDGDRVSLNMELTTGGGFNMAQPVPSQDTSYGTMLIVFAACNGAQVTFDFPGPGLSGSFPITRVVGDNIPLCESLAGQGQTHR